MFSTRFPNIQSNHMFPRRCHSLECRNMEEKTVSKLGCEAMNLD